MPSPLQFLLLPNDAPKRPSIESPSQDEPPPPEVISSHQKAMQHKQNSLLELVLKTIQKCQISSSQSQSSGNSELAVIKSSSSIDSSERRIKMVKKPLNFYKKLLRMTPNMTSNHIYNLFGVTSINEKSIENPDHEESYIFNFFRYRTVTKVQFFDNALLIQLNEPQIPTHQPTVEYLIQKFKSKGDMNFFQIAKTIEEVTRLYAQIAHLKPPSQKPESVLKYIRGLGQTMFLGTLGSKRVAISYSMIKYLGYNAEEMAIDMIKYRTICLEIFSAQTYPVGIKYNLNCIKYMAELALGKITFQQFSQLTAFSFQDFIISKDNVKSFVDTTVYFVTPSCYIHKIDKVHYKTDQAGGKFLLSEEHKLAIQNQKEQFRQEEYKVLLKLKSTIPGYYLKENDKKTAGFVEIQRKQNSLEKSMKEEA